MVNLGSIASSEGWGGGEAITSKAVIPFSPSIRLTLSTQNKLFGNESNANDHTQQFI